MLASRRTGEAIPKITRQKSSLVEMKNELYEFVKDKVRGDEHQVDRFRCVT